MEAVEAIQPEQLATATEPAASFVGAGARTEQFPISAAEEKRRKKLLALINEGKLFRDARQVVEILLKKQLAKRAAAGETPK